MRRCFFFLLVCVKYHVIVTDKNKIDQSKLNMSTTRLCYLKDIRFVWIMNGAKLKAWAMHVRIVTCCSSVCVPDADTAVVIWHIERTSPNHGSVEMSKSLFHSVKFSNKLKNVGVVWWICAVLVSLAFNQQRIHFMRLSYILGKAMTLIYLSIFENIRSTGQHNKNDS